MRFVFFAIPAGFVCASQATKTPSTTPRSIPSSCLKWRRHRDETVDENTLTEGYLLIAPNELDLFEGRHDLTSTES